MGLLWPHSQASQPQLPRANSLSPGYEMALGLRPLLAFSQCSGCQESLWGSASHHSDYKAQGRHLP